MHTLWPDRRSKETWVKISQCKTNLKWTLGRLTWLWGESKATRRMAPCWMTAPPSSSSVVVGLSGWEERTLALVLHLIDKRTSIRVHLFTALFPGIFSRVFSLLNAVSRLRSSGNWIFRYAESSSRLTVFSMQHAFADEVYLRVIFYWTMYYSHTVLAESLDASRVFPGLVVRGEIDFNVY